MRRETSYNEVHDAQRYYRLLMDSMARPGKINTLYEMDVLPPGGLNKATSLVALSLLNADVSFHRAGENRDAINSYILLNTSSSPVDLPLADFIFIEGKDDGNIISEIKLGTLPYPEEGATVVIDVQSIAALPKQESLKITLKGPGIETETIVYVKGLNVNILQALSDVNSEFPLGVDAIFTDMDNNIICIPRSNRFSWTN